MTTPAPAEDAPLGPVLTRLRDELAAAGIDARPWRAEWLARAAGARADVAVWHNIKPRTGRYSLDVGPVSGDDIAIARGATR